MNAEPLWSEDRVEVILRVYRSREWGDLTPALVRVVVLMLVRGSRTPSALA